MPRYYFDTVDGRAETDSVGEEFKNVAAAQNFAVSYSGSVLKDRPEIAAAPQGFRVHVLDENRRPLLSVVTTVSRTSD